MEIGNKVEIHLAWADYYKDLPRKQGTIVAMADEWIVVRVSGLPPQVSPFAVKRPWELLLIPDDTDT